MTTQILPGVVLQWKAVGPFNQAPDATVSIRPYFPFGENVNNNRSLVFPSSNAESSVGTFFATPLVGTFDTNGRLLGPDGYPLVVPALDANTSSSWLQSPTLYSIQIDLAGLSSQKGVFAAFQNPANNFSQGFQSSGVLLTDNNAYISALTANGSGGYSGTITLSDTVVHPILVNQTISVSYLLAGTITVVVNSINLLTNSMSVTSTVAKSALANCVVGWGNSGYTNIGVNLANYVNWY